VLWIADATAVGGEIPRLTEQDSPFSSRPYYAWVTNG